MNDREKALEAALRDIARQRKTDEMPREDRRNGDFEGACDTMIDVARAALAMPATVDGADFLRGWEAGRDAAASWHDERIAILDEQIAENNAYAERTGAAAWEANKYCGDLKSAHRLAACSIRNLTPPEDAP